MQCSQRPEARVSQLSVPPAVGRSEHFPIDYRLLQELYRISSSTKGAELHNDSCLSSGGGGVESSRGAHRRHTFNRATRCRVVCGPRLCKDPAQPHGIVSPQCQNCGCGRCVLQMRCVHVQQSFQARSCHHIHSSMIGHSLGRMDLYNTLLHSREALGWPFILFMH